MWSSTEPAHCSSSNNTVVSTTQLVSVTPAYNVPPPVTRHSSGTAGMAQFTQFWHELGAVVTALPAVSKMHGMPVLATAVPWIVADTVAPGQLTVTQPILVTTVWPAGTNTTGGVIEAPVAQSTSGVVLSMLPPITLTFRSP